MSMRPSDPEELQYKFTDQKVLKIRQLNTLHLIFTYLLFQVLHDNND